MLKILIVEDEPLLAATIKHLVELNPRYQVTAIADDVESAVEAVEARHPDLALVDLQLAHGSTGYSVAYRLNEQGIPCLFTTGNVPSFPMPELALGCLAKPFSEEDLVRALKTAEDVLRGRERLRPSLPDALQLYPAGGEGSPPVRAENFMGIPAFLFAPGSLRSRLLRWLGA